ncbi:MAG: phosphatase PAP2 family protein [candidate division FCPU426 bacterium]
MNPNQPVPLKPHDYTSLGYLGLVSLALVFFGSRLPDRNWLLAGYLGYAAVILLLVWLAARFPRNRWAAFFRLGYPLLAILFLYRGIEGHVLLWHGQFLDAQVAEWERSVLGAYPNLALESLVSRPLTEVLKFSYFSYYFYIALPPLLLFFLHRETEMEIFIFTASLTFYVSFVGFVLVPLEGPRYYFAQQFRIPHLEGYFFSPLQDWLMSRAAARGACFPSSHLAVAWVSLFLVRRFFGSRPFWLILPLTVGMTFAIVYNRYHYAVDAVAGLFVGWACWHLSRWLLDRLAKRAPQNRSLRANPAGQMP